MKRFAVLGSPIEHSLSPILHNHLYKREGIAATYERFLVDKEQLEGFLQNHGVSQWSGFSLTMPLKDEGVAFCANLDEDSALASSVNTLLATEHGWNGYNTDVFGFRFLLSKFKDIMAKSSLKKKVAVLGAGGTARAALVALRDTGLDVDVYRRNEIRDEKLNRANPSINIKDWSDRNSAFESALLINCAPFSAMTSFGEVPTYEGMLIDSLYSPWPTPLIERTMGNHLSGKDLLVAQAIRQMEIFLEIELSHAELFNELRALI